MLISCVFISLFKISNRLKIIYTLLHLVYFWSFRVVVSICMPTRGAVMETVCTTMVAPWWPSMEML